MTKENQILLIKIRNFAIDCHKNVNQLYDGLPYHVHLQNVVNYVNKFKHLLTEDEYILTICVAWCHDILEDANMTYNDLKKVVGNDVADIVFLLTNHRGKNRGERANHDYYLGIKNNHIALFVKLCDRLGNLTHSVIYNTDTNKLEMYIGEIPHFKEKLYNGLYDEMWDYLEHIQDQDFIDNYYYPEIEKFDEITIYRIHLPNPIPYALYHELYNKGVIRKKDLIKNHYYQGKCRNANVALWNGFEFVYMRNKFGVTYPETINHIEDDKGNDLFIAFKEVQPTEQQRIRY